MADIPGASANPYAALGSAGLNFITGMFTKPKPVNPYAPQLEEQARQLGAVRQGYQGMTDSARSGYSEFDPKYRRSVNDYADYLTHDPYTDQAGARIIGNATAGSNMAYNAAKANLAAEMARRGIGGSSVDNGALGSIEAAHAGQLAGAENNLAMQRIASQGQRMSALTGLLGGVTSDYRGAEGAGLSGQAGTTNDIASIYSGLNSQANTAAALENGAQQSAIGGFGQSIGQFAGAGGFNGVGKLFRRRGGSSGGDGTPPGLSSDEWWGMNGF